MSSIHRLALPAGTQLKDYQILDVLGQGGFGITYSGVNIALDQQVAIKEYLPAAFAVRDDNTLSVHPSGADSEDIFQWGLKRFLEEARILARLSHPHIVRVLFFMSLNETGYMVMEFLEGQTLGGWLQERKDAPVSQQDVLTILDPLTDALALVHDNGLAHRDIKPDNIFMRNGTTPVLIDFGAARNVFSGQSQTVAAIVTPGYSPNEQYSGVAEQGPWTDIYALGGVVYRMIAGGAPPDAPSRVAKEMAGEQDPCRPLAEIAVPTFDPAFLEAIDWALKLRPNERPRNVRVWREALGLGMRAASTPTEVEIAQSGFDKIGGEKQFNRTTATQPGTYASLPRTDDSVQPSLDKQTQLGGRGRFLAIATAVMVLLIAISAGIWLFSSDDKDRIGNSLSQAFPIGTLTAEAQSIQDAIGGGDTADFLAFNIEADGELKLSWDHRAADAKLRLISRDNRAIAFFEDDDIQLAQISAGKYWLEISSESALKQSYAFDIQAVELSEQNQPGSNPVTALSLTDRGKFDGKDVLFDGRIWAQQREHFFKLNLSKRSRVTAFLDVSAASGNLVFTDASGIASAGREIRNDSVAPLIAELPAGEHYIAITMRNATPWAYRLKVKTEEPQAVAGHGSFDRVSAAEGKSFETAQILPDLTGDIQTIDIKISSRPPERYFAVRTGESGLLIVNAESTLFKEFELFHSGDGSRIARTVEGDRLSLRAKVEQGSYVLKLTSTDVPANGKMTLAFASGAVVGAARDNPVILGQLGGRLIKESGRLTPRMPEKWFSFELKDDMRVRIEMTGQGGGALPAGTTLSVRGTKKDYAKSFLVQEYGELLIRDVSLKRGHYVIRASAPATDNLEYSLRFFTVTRLSASSRSVGGRKPKSKGTAVVRLRFDSDRRELLQIAKAAARNRAIAAASGSLAVAEQKEPVAAAHSLTSLNVGVPYNEEWEAQWLGSDRLAVSVDARIRLLNSNSSNFIARLSKERFVTNERIPILLTSANPLSLGLFAWQADGTIGRIYPQAAGRSFTLQPGKDIDITNRMQLTVTSAPVPGESASDEAIIVLACEEPAAYETLAPTFAEAAVSSLTRAIEATVFLERLARFCPESLHVRALSYRVENPGN